MRTVLIFIALALGLVFVISARVMALKKGQLRLAVEVGLPQSAPTTRQKAADSSELLQIQAVLDEVTARFGFSKIHSARKSRICAAELAFRSGRRGGIDPMIVARGMNRFTSDLHGAPYLRTTQAQVEIYGEGLGKLFPRLFKAELVMSKAEFSPLAAVVLTEAMLHLKVTSRQWQVSPEEWVRRVQDQRAPESNSDPIVQPRLAVSETSDHDNILEERLRRAFERHLEVFLNAIGV